MTEVNNAANDAEQPELDLGLPPVQPETVTVLASEYRELIATTQQLAQLVQKLRAETAEARAEAARFADACFVLTSARRPVVDTPIGPLEATSAGLVTLSQAIINAGKGRQ